MKAVAKRLRTPVSGNPLKRILSGDFTPRELRYYVIFLTSVFWGLIFASWMNFPKDHHFSIMTHTFSFLGSFENKHNPERWWIFSIAMAFWGTASVPLMLYFRRRFALISPWGAAVGAFLFLAGCTGIVLIAIFPDAHGKVIGDFEYTHIHMKAAFLVAAAFGLGIPWHALLLLLDWIAGKRSGAPSAFTHGKYLWPYGLWTVMVSVAMYFQIKWEFVYAEMKAAAAASGASIGSHWSEALNTRYSFPLWENLVIYTLFIFLMWLAATLSADAAEE